MPVAERVKRVIGNLLIGDIGVVQDDANKFAELLRSEYHDKEALLSVLSERGIGTPCTSYERGSDTCGNKKQPCLIPPLFAERRAVEFAVSNAISCEFGDTRDLKSTRPVVKCYLFGNEPSHFQLEKCYDCITHAYSTLMH